MKFKTIDDFEFKNKTVLLRVDLNTEVIKGKAISSERIKQHAKTIKELVRKKAKVIVIAHQSRPGKKDFIGLRQHGKLLRKYVKIKFVNDVVGRKAVRDVKKLRPGEALLLDNVRFLKEEFKPGKGNRIVKTLRPLCDYYVNDAFSVSHRNQTSITGFKEMPSCMGRTMERELKNLQNIKLRHCLFILGGAKPEDNILLMKHKKILTCGIFGQLCLIAKGHDLGAQNRFLKDRLKYVSKLKKVVRNKQTPIDLAIKIKGKRKDLDLKKFPSEHEIFDIGPKTVRKYKEIIRKADYVFMKGTAGYCEEKQFCKGTKAILKTLEKSRAYIVMGGGHTLGAVRRLRIKPRKNWHMSLSGGALVDYMAGKKLPGLEVLKNA